MCPNSCIIFKLPLEAFSFSVLLCMVWKMECIQCVLYCAAETI